MKRILTTIGAFFCVLPFCMAQISVEECYELAKKNYPLIRQYELIGKTEQFNLSNANKAYLPQLSVSAKASYQSDVAKLPIAVPGMDIPSMSKDQYVAELHLSQVIWDGGIVKNSRDQIKANTVAGRKELEANLYQINERINDLFFGTLLINAQIESNLLYQTQLDRSYKQVNNFMQQGIANQSDLDIVQVEILNAKQNNVNLRANKRSFIEMLSYFIGQDLSDETRFMIPSVTSNLLPQEIRRPELEMYDAKLKELDIKKKNIHTALMPKFELFATGGYGRPGLNMLKDKFEPYYIGGVRMAWNFGSLYTKSNDNKIISVAQENWNVQRETFIFNTNIAMKQENSAIVKNRELLKHDDEIVKLRTRIREASEIKLANGTISTTDFMKDITAEDMAKQERIAREMELLLTIYKHQYITNNREQVR